LADNTSQGIGQFSTKFIFIRIARDSLSLRISERAGKEANSIGVIAKNRIKPIVFFSSYYKDETNREIADPLIIEN